MRWFLFIYPFNKYLWWVYYVPGSVINSRDIIVNKQLTSSGTLQKPANPTKVTWTVTRRPTAEQAGWLIEQLKDVIAKICSLWNPLSFLLGDTRYLPYFQARHSQRKQMGHFCHDPFIWKKESLARILPTDFSPILLAEGDHHYLARGMGHHASHHPGYSRLNLPQRTWLSEE